ALRGESQAGLWPILALTLGWITPEDDQLKRFAAAPGALRSLQGRALGDLLRIRASARPVCILVDDAHFAEDLLLDVLEYAALAEARLPVWVCAFAKPALSQARPAWGERAANFEKIDLPPLATHDAERLCRELLIPAVNIPLRAIHKLVHRAEGIPLLMIELV